jgi:hypothetical protein
MKLTNKEAADVIMRTQIQLGRMNGKMLLSSALLKAVEVLRKAPEWIPVSERLPKEMQKVLIWFEYYRYGDFNCMYQTYGFGYVCDGKWSPFINGKTGWQDYRVIAWQPLPEPYKEEGESDADS